MPWFTPRRIEVLRARTARLVGDLLDEVGGAGGCEFMADVAVRIPPTIFCWMVGCDVSRGPELAHWSGIALQAFSGDPAVMDDVRDAIRYLRRFAAELLEAKQGEPGDDITTALVAGIEQGLLTHADARSLLTELLSASVDNTTHSMGLMIWLLSEHPDQWALVAGDADLVERAVEECARFEPVIRHGKHFNEHEAELLGIAVPAGTLMTAYLDAAHRDPDVYDDPDRFDVTRRLPQPQLIFGIGRHYCIGAALARMQIQEVLRAVTTRWTQPRLASGVSLKPRSAAAKSHPFPSSFSHWRTHDHHRRAAALGPRADLRRARRPRRSPPRSKASSPTSIASARSTTSSASATIEPRAVTDADVAALETCSTATNELQTELRPVNAYLYGLVTTDSRNERAGRAHGRAADAHRRARPARRSGSARGWRRSASRTFVARSDARGRARVRAAQGGRRRRAPDERARGVARRRARAVGLARVAAAARRRVVAADGRDRRPDGTIERVPMALARGLATHPDAARRRAAYEGELAAWETVAVPLAAALNGAKGELGVLNRRRGFADDLEPALRANNVDRAHARRDDRRGRRRRCPSFRRYLRAKARLLGHDGGLPWWDLFAPVGDAGEVAWAARDRRWCATRSRGYSPELAGARRRGRSPSSWVDAEIRDGKRGGAYCMSVDGDVSRVMMNFDGSHDSVSTLAHELGHAFHNVALAERTPMQRRTADGARRDRVDLLRDAALRDAPSRSADRRRANGSRCSTRTSSARRRSSSTSTAGSCSRRELCRRRRRTALSVAELNDDDARRAGGGVRRRARIPTTATSTCGR